MHIKFSHFWISDFSNFNNHRSLIVYIIYATFYGQSHAAFRYISKSCIVEEIHTVI